MMTATPYLFYNDVAAAAKWLCEAFGFRETVRYSARDGAAVHAEIDVDGDIVMLGTFGPGYRNPKQTGLVSQLVFVSVDDVDSHFRHAKEAGATILAEPEDKPYGQRQYVAEDPEGHRWGFGQQVRDVLPEEWAVPASEAAAGPPASVDA